MRYILDTNIWVELARKRLTCNDLRGRPGVQIALAPLATIELVTGIIRGGEARFGDNKAMIACMAQGQPEILELPRIFVYRLIFTLPPSGSSDVRPEHYMLLMNLVLQSTSLASFLAKAESPGSVWKQMTDLHSIQESVLGAQLVI